MNQDVKAPKQCPNPPKGERCPVCGGEWICLAWKLPKRSEQEVANGK